MIEPSEKIKRRKKIFWNKGSLLFCADGRPKAYFDSPRLVCAIAKTIFALFFIFASFNRGTILHCNSPYAKYFGGFFFCVKIGAFWDV